MKFMLLGWLNHLLNEQSGLKKINWYKNLLIYSQVRSNQVSSLLDLICTKVHRGKKPVALRLCLFQVCVSRTKYAWVAYTDSWDALLDDASDPEI